MISSVIVINRLNGATRRIRESHTHTLGVPPIEYNYEAPLDVSQVTLDANLITHAAKIDERLADSEADALSEIDQPIVAGDHADIAIVVIAYLRKAMLAYDSFDAYRKFVRFNDYRVAQGWSIAQVVTNLLPYGLTQEEWDLMYIRYLYLNNATRVQAMIDYQAVLNGDPRA